MAWGSCPANLWLNGIGSRFGRFLTNRSVFSLQMVATKSSLGVPKSSVMMENWCTSGKLRIRWLNPPLYFDNAILTVLSWEQGLSFQHFSKDTASTPDINSDIILLPSQHDLGCTIISGGYVTCHLRILDTSKTEIANLEIAVLVDEDVAWFLLRMYSVYAIA